MQDLCVIINIYDIYRTQKGWLSKFSVGKVFLVLMFALFVFSIDSIGIGMSEMY